MSEYLPFLPFLPAHAPPWVSSGCASLTVPAMLLARRNELLTVVSYQGDGPQDSSWRNLWLRGDGPEGLLASNLLGSPNECDS